MTYVQLFQPSYGAVQRGQGFVYTHIQCFQPIYTAIQNGQGRVLAHVQRGQRISGAVQRGQRRVLAHIQTGQLVIIAAQRDQCSILTHIQGGQLVIIAAQRGQRRVLAHIQTGQIVAIAVQLGQCSVLAHIQCGQLVVAAGQRGQGRVPAHIQGFQIVLGAVQLGQRRVPAHIQAGQLVKTAVQISQSSEVLNALEIGNLHARAVDFRHSRNLSVGQTTLARRVKAGADIAAEVGIREVGLIDQQVAAFIHLSRGSVEGAGDHVGILRHCDGQGNRHGIGFHNGVGVVVVADFHAFGIIRRGGKGQNAGFRVIAAAGDIAHAGQVFHAHKAAQIQQQLALLPIGGRGRCLRCAIQLGQRGVAAQVQFGQLVSEAAESF